MTPVNTGTGLKTNNGPARVLLACGTVAGPLFFATVVIQALVRPGFDVVRHPISLLSVGDLGWIQRANFVTCGLLLIGFAVGVRRVLGSRPAGTWGPVLLAVYGAGTIVAGLFAPDPAFGFPPGAPEGTPTQLSLHSTLHGVGFTLAFVSAALTCLVFARRYAALGQRGWLAYCLATALVGTTLGMWPSNQAAGARFFVAGVIVWAWVAAVGTQLMNETSHVTRRQAESVPAS